MRMLAFGHPQGESLGVEEAIGVGTCGEAVRPLARARLNRSPPSNPFEITLVCDGADAQSTVERPKLPRFIWAVCFRR